VAGAAPRIAETARASGADAVFFTSNTAGALPMLLELLPQYGAGPDRYQYIGLTRWDVPAEALRFARCAGGVVHDAGSRRSPRGSMRATAPPLAVRRMPIAGFAYDGIAAIGASMASGRRDALGPAALSRSSGFQSLTGVFRLMPDGTNERGLAVAQIRDGRVVIVDPAPRGFAGPGS
jgi:hypothetical protein